MLSGAAIFPQSMDIKYLHNNNASGVPDLLDQLVTISGEVTATIQFGVTAYVQDYSGGIAVYDDNFATSVNVGDWVTISGTVKQFYGLTELKNITLVERIVRAPSIAAAVVTCSEIQAEGSGGMERLEGELLRLNNVTVNTENWSVTGSGSNYILSDATGSCEIRIDKDTDLANTLAPGSSKFDVIGILSQYDNENPFISGYQLMPRFNDDVIWRHGPRIMAKPEETNITDHSMTITWETESASNSLLSYGKTTNYEVGTIQREEAVTFHLVEMVGLSPATVYHVKVASADQTGINYSPDHVVITASDPSSTGKMNVYFNRSVDHHLAAADNEADGNEDLTQRFIDRVKAANYSIDLCFYSWDELPQVTEAVLEAYSRGVDIRFIHDADHGYQTEVGRLKNAGIPVIDQQFSTTPSLGIQHNKFAIFDAADETSFADDWVWTGSLNLTNYPNLGINAAQNVIEIQDQALAKAYTMEFNEMWGSETVSPDAAKSRFGSYKTDNTPHKFVINQIPVELYFCPSDLATAKLIEAINSANKEIYFCILAFTRSDMAEAMHARFSVIDGLHISGVFDSEPDLYSQWFPMHGEGSHAWNPPADVWLKKESGVLHHKYLIIDPNHRDSDPIVFTGSQNWSISAETKNDENTLIIHSPLIANQYVQEFADRYHAAGGGNNLTQVAWQPVKVPHEFILAQNYPNPFNTSTTIEFCVLHPVETKVVIFNLKGQIVKTLELHPTQQGKQKLTWNGVDDSGEKIASGIYFYSLIASGVTNNLEMKKMIYLP